MVDPDYSMFIYHNHNFVIHNYVTCCTIMKLPAVILHPSDPKLEESNANSSEKYSFRKNPE